MDKITYTGSQNKIESFMLIVFSVYAATIMIVSSRPIGFFVLFLLMVCWILYSCKYKTYEVRVRITSVIMQVCAILYGVQRESVVQTVPVLIVFVIFMGLYGIADIITMTLASTAVIFFAHAFVLRTVAFSSAAEVMNYFSQIINVLLAQYVVYIWTKRNSEGSKQLLDTIEELKVVQRSKDDFVANVSHEIRTPINTICGMSEIILREEIPYKIKENVLNIQMSGRGLMGVVSDILDFSELQSGKIEPEEEAYNITSTINDVINSSMARKEDKKIEILVDCDATIPSILLGDEKKLRRVIMNLMSNAIKFTEEGYVCLKVSYRKESYGINLVVSVKDTGIGMDEESLEKLFVGFSQVDTSRKRQEGGLGLGLAISRALVEKMNGALTVKSKPGKGTIIQIVVPQKVVDETPIASLYDRQNIRVATYIDMEQFEMAAIRDEYSDMIVHMAEQLKGKCHICRNLAELQRRQEKEGFSHVFISTAEYRQSQSYFDELATKTKLVVVLNHYEDKYISNPAILRIYKPFYILSIVSVLNGLQGKYYDRHNVCEKFITRDVHVLAVDDNRMNLMVIQEFLANYKIKVTTALSGKEALEKIETADYDFVFMDHMMPEMDGVETMHRIRHKVGTYYQKVPVIALTANAVAGTREMLMAEGFSDFLEKPVERSVLERVLKRNLPHDKIISTEQVQELSLPKEEIKTETSKSSEIPEIEGLDVAKGILYCNGKEPYLKVLRGYCEDWNQTGLLAEASFEQQDWKNYTIAVHGLKSAMKSIGATDISEEARKLEFAGKEYRIDYILENHSKLMEKYRALFVSLRNNEWVWPEGAISEPVDTKTEEELLSELEEIEDALLDEKIACMEEAMYNLEGERLLEIVTELQNYQYRGVSLREFLVPVRRKIERSDYISAVETVLKWKDGFDR
ncbi:MAG: response regulator [Lachnospiraceae bacterium]|nr:response regulator [Lachnospiraceae bacterium]